MLTMFMSWSAAPSCRRVGLHDYIVREYDRTKAKKVPSSTRDFLIHFWRVWISSNIEAGTRELRGFPQIGCIHRVRPKT